MSKPDKTEAEVRRAGLAAFAIVFAGFVAAAIYFTYGIPRGFPPYVVMTYIACPPEAPCYESKDAEILDKQFLDKHGLPLPKEHRSAYEVCNIMEKKLKEQFPKVRIGQTKCEEF